MPIYKIRAPDGSVISIRATDEQTAMRGVREHYDSRAPAPAPSPAPGSSGKYSGLQELITGRKPGDTPGYRAALAAKTSNIKRTPAGGALGAFGNGMLFGFNDELEGAGDAVNTWLGNHLGNKAPYNADEAYRASRDAVRANARTFAKEHPVQNIGATIAGSLVSPGALSGARYISQAPRAASALARTAVVAGAQGALAGAGNADGGMVQRAKGAALGGAIGAGAGVALGAGGRAVVAAGRRAAAALPSSARQLSNAGVLLTPGDMVGGLGKRAEDALQSTPILGDAIRGAKIRGIESFDRAAINRVLAPINEALPDGINVGRDALQHAEARVSDAYTRALGPVNVVPDAQFTQQVQAVLNTPNLPGAIRTELNDIVANSVTGRLGQGVDGQTWKAVDSELGAMARAADNASANQPTSRYLRDAIRQIQEAHFDLLHRTDPAAAAAVQQTDHATANLVRIRQASQATGARGGMFSPAQLNNAVRATDTSAGNRQFARGTALMQDLTDPAMDVLPQSVPDSGTAFRSLLTVGGLSGGGMAVGARPEAVAAGIGSLTAGAALYSRPVQGALNAVYRAATPGQARVALGSLADVASRYPEAAPLYDALVHRLPNAEDQRTQPQGQP